MESLRIGVVGLPGVGKSTFVDNLRAEFLRRGFPYERVREWHSQEVMDHFYSDMENNALETELTLLGHRCIQWKKSVSTHNNGVIFDRMVWCSGVFAETTLGEEELHLYKEQFKILSKNLKKPDIVIFLWSPAGVAHERMIQRSLCSSRENEQNVPIGYMNELAIYHELLYQEFKEQNPETIFIRLDWSNFGDVEKVLLLIEAITAPGSDKLKAKLTWEAKKIDELCEILIK